MTFDHDGSLAPSVADDRRAEIEAHLRSVFAEVLAIDAVGTHDDFFELGGHSLLVMRAAVRIEARLGVHIPVSLLFDYPTVAALAPRVDALGANPHHVPVEQAAPDGTPDQASPLSPAQRGLWFLDQAIGQHAAYLLPDAWRLRGPLDIEALRQALESIVAQHSALATHFEVVDGEPRQHVGPLAGFALPQIDLRGLSPLEQEATVARLAAEEADRPFDLEHDLLLRASLLVLADEDHVLLLTAHHVASDAWSQRILRRELERLYRACRTGVPIQTQGVPDAYVTYATRQQARMTTARRSALGAYWRQQLAGLPVLELPADRRRLTAWSDHGAEFIFQVPSDLTTRLERLATDSHVTLQMLLLAAYQVLLGRYTGQSDFGIATFASNRQDAAVEDLIGLFVNAIILRADLSGAPAFRELLARVRKTSLDAYDHQDFPFEALVAELRPERQDGPSPLSPAAFQVLPFGDTPPQLDGLVVTPLPCATRRVRFDLEVTIWKELTGLRGVLGYSTDLFDDSTIERFAGYYLTLLEAIVETPDCPLAELRLLADVDRDEQLTRWSGIAVSQDAPGVVHEQFTARATSTPDATALVFDERRLTYRELDERADQLAARLWATGVRAGDVVALHLPRSVELIVSMLGILKAGAAYLPLDPSHPIDRLAFMVRKGGASALIADGTVPAALASAVPHHLSCTEDATSPARVTPPSSSPVTSPASPAYVMFTSGSTGQPKGVLIPHQGIARLVRDTDYVRFTPDDCVAFASNPAFDAATFEIWGALLNGARLVLIHRDTLLSPTLLAQAMQAHGITVMFLTSALFHQVAALAPGILASLRCMVAGGDVVDPAAARAVLDAGAPAHLVNGYGPTENTTFSATYEITPEFSGPRSVPIGRPIAGSTCYVLDHHRALLPVGAIGELYVGGLGLALEYVSEPQLTVDRFVPHPFAAGERLYRTGDRVRWRADGQLEFLGRVDRQIKLSGHRIELEEIEHALSRHDAITACTVVLLDDRRTGHPRLVAYAVGRDGPPPSSDEIRGSLRQTLPSCMVPDVVVWLRALPLTPNGKVDRAALPPPETPQPRAATPDAARRASSATPMETLVANTFKDVLGLDHVEHDVSFFAIGGTSLSAFRLVDRLGKACGRPVSVSTVFAHPTISALAAALVPDEAIARPRSILELRRGGSKPPLYFPPGVLGEIVVSDAFREELSADQPLYALIDPPGDGARAASIEAMAARFCADIIAFQPTGPICLAGYSFGGLVAYEMARQFTAAGRDIKALAILDTGPDLSAGASLKSALTRIRLCLVNVPRWIGEDIVRSFSKDTPATLWRSVRKIVRSFGRPQTGGPGQLPRADDLFQTSHWSPALRAHVENNLRILSAFHYGPYPGRVTLFRARVRPLLHAHLPDLGWGSLASETRVIEAPGNHHTMTEEPHIRIVARKLRAVLEE